MSLLRNVKPVEHASSYALIFGLFAYGLLFVAYSYVYSGVDLSISDLGLSYLDVLRNSAGTLLLLVATVLLIGTVLSMFQIVRVVLGLALLATLVALAWPSGMNHLPGGHSLINVEKSARTWATKPFVDRRDALRAGRSIEPLRFHNITIVDFPAAPATLQLANSMQSTTGNTAPRHDCVLYFGQTNDRLVVYDRVSHKVVKVPAAGMSITLEHDGRCIQPVPVARTSQAARPPAAKTHAPEPRASHSHAFFAQLDVDGHQYFVHYSGQSFVGLRRKVEDAMQVGKVVSFDGGSRGWITISFKAASNVELRELSHT